jgi:acetyl-CoA C-acetyltransferase
MLENARRHRLGLSRADYARKQMGTVFAPFTVAASRNPHAAMRDVMTAEELATVTDRNRMISDPYTRLLVARDQVNQAAAVILTSVGEARRRGIAENKWVYLHGYADLSEPAPVKRPDPSRSPAAIEACKAAIAAAGLTQKDVALFELYSCFPIAVLNVADGLDMAVDDPRGFTISGGLPYFGGPGNNFAMHSIAEMVMALRKRPGAYGLVGANGGYLSKYSAGVYSTAPREWRTCDSSALQAKLDSAPRPKVAHEADGAAHIETYSVAYSKGAPASATIMGRLDKTHERFIAVSTDPATVARMVKEEPIGQAVTAQATPKGNRFSF